MKQNAVGLANICILSTAVIIIVSTTLSLYMGMQNLLDSRFAHSFNVTVSNGNQEQINSVDALIEETAKENNLKITNDVSANAVSVTGTKENDNVKIPVDANNSMLSAFEVYVFLTLDEYNKLESKDVSLNNNQILLFNVGDEYKKDIIEINGKEFEIKDNLKTLKLDKKVDNPIVETNYIVTKDFDTIKDVLGEENTFENYTRGFDFEGNNIETVEKTLSDNLQGVANNVSTDVKSFMIEEFYELYGSLFFIGIYLGAMFLMATVLIIYYKQISEGFDDKGRYEVMQKVGMSKKEVKSSIKSQVLTIFFLPLIMAIIHVCAAFPVMTKLLAILNLTNTTLFVIAMVICIIIFAIIYVIVYLLTARQYYRIVN
ncbi:MAG: hypothetical protein ACK5LL_14540 [Suipraeoptans sp.]